MFAQAQTTSQLYDYSKEFEDQKSSKKHKELLKVLGDKLWAVIVKFFLGIGWIWGLYVFPNKYVSLEVYR